MKLKTNEEVLEMVKETRTMMSTIRRQVRFVGHISREKGLEKVCLEGKLEENKGRGRPRQSFMNALTLATGMDSSSEWFQETGRQHQSLTRYTKKKTSSKNTCEISKSYTPVLSCARTVIS